MPYLPIDTLIVRVVPAQRMLPSASDIHAQMSLQDQSGTPPERLVKTGTSPFRFL